MQEYKTHVIQKTLLADSIVELQLQLLKPKALQFQAGQYVQLLTDYTFRAYSMVNAPGLAGDCITLCIKLVENGIASEYIQGLRVGDTVRLRGPFGEFTIRDPAKDILLVANGIGIAPFMSHIQWLLNTKAGSGIMLLYGTRHESDIVYEAQYQAWAEQYPRFNYAITLSQPSLSWQGSVGRVTQYLIAHQDTYKNRDCYLCGSQAMVTDIRDMLLKGGVPAESIFQEIFI